ncbi:hypothetical protein BDY19DRAFT_893087 [Irpex rosettiformis]|uniref:Uncharacterized protein n=1 Tax=Irpex rosettiformis TaxID=378272 RepID=A0ACB8TZT5_9APHY|nr:hypothetical protein BDY19DRAFT_893087 [Irpex rosettiformis]
MSRPDPQRTPNPSLPSLRRPKRVVSAGGAARPNRPPTRRPSLSGGLTRAAGIAPVSGQKQAQRTSKTTQKLVVLPSEPQTKPLLAEDDEDIQHGYETDRGLRDVKSEGERMSKEQRQKAGFKRITAYCVSEGFKMKLLTGFLKREHNVQPRVFDEAVYVMYHLPLLPGYGPGINVRSSAAPAVIPTPIAIFEAGDGTSYDGPYLSSSAPTQLEGFSPGTSPNADTVYATDVDTPKLTPAELSVIPAPPQRRPSPPHDTDTFGEVVFFQYGVVVFFGLDASQEHSILEDVEGAGIMSKPRLEDRWEVEECHYEYKPYIAYPRIYNDFFTFKSHSTLLTLSVSHALAQSTLLARYETVAHDILSAPATTAIPIHLASTGSLKLSRTEALKLTGKLFKLRRDVNLVSNVLDIPDLFWEEGQASMRALYDAVRDYMEIGVRVGVLNEKLAVAEDLLDAIHDHLNTNAMDRITWIIIWLIVAACLVEMGEVLARLVVHATSRTVEVPDVATIANMTGDQAIQVLQQLALSKR